MNRILLLLVLILAASAPLEAQTHIRIGQPAQAEWDQPENASVAGITRYEWQLDGRPWADTGLPAAAANFVFPIPQSLLTLGPHTFRARACNQQECGPAASVTFTVDPAIPGAPRNLRMGVSQQQVSLQEAVDIANAYATIVLRRPLTATDLTYLVSRYPDSTLTVGNVLAFLDAEYVALTGGTH